MLESQVVYPMYYSLYVNLKSGFLFTRRYSPRWPARAMSMTRSPLRPMWRRKTMSPSIYREPEPPLNLLEVKDTATHNIEFNRGGICGTVWRMQGRSVDHQSDWRNFWLEFAKRAGADRQQVRHRADKDKHGEAPQQTYQTTLPLDQRKGTQGAVYPFACEDNRKHRRPANEKPESSAATEAAKSVGATGKALTTMKFLWQRPQAKVVSSPGKWDTKFLIFI